MKKIPLSRKRGRNRKDEILAAARELFLKNGYRTTTIEQIARHAGYSKRSVYLDYPTKDDLFITVATEGLEILVSQLQEIKDTESSLEEFISRYLETITVFSHDHSDYFKMLTTEVTPEIIAGCSPEVRIRAMEFETAGISLMADAVDKAVRQEIIPETNPWEVAEIFIGGVVGIIMLSMGGSQVMLSYEKMKSRVNRMGHILFRGLLEDRKEKSSR